VPSSGDHKEEKQTMANHPHLHSLQAKHRQLDEIIRKEQMHPAADSGEIARMKREKLALKEQIARFA
jgi:hypothetical protein